MKERGKEIDLPRRIRKVYLVSKIIKSPCKKKNLKKMAINNNRKSNGYKFYFKVKRLGLLTALQHCSTASLHHCSTAQYTHLPAHRRPVAL